MSRTGLVATLLGGVVLADVLLHVAAYVALVRAQRRRVAACPFGDDDAALSATAVLAGFVREVAASLGMFLVVPRWPRPLRPHVDGDPSPVILVHGWGVHRGVFGAFRRRLQRDGWETVVAFRSPSLRGDVERGARRLGCTIEAVRRATGAPTVDVVAHGMGGLVARAYLRAAGPRAGVGRLITIATAHQGTAALAWLHGATLLRQMRPGSPLLVALGAVPPPSGTEVVALYAADDPFVEPPDHGYWPGVLNIEVRGAVHLALLHSPRVYELVSEHLQPVGAAAPGMLGRGMVS